MKRVDVTTIGKALMLLGGVTLVVGLLLWGAGRLGLTLGQLPGDIRIERDGFSFYLPLTTMILISVVLTIIVNLLLRLWKK